MNRVEYLDELKKKLKRLPKEDFDKAIDYYEEYFDEAGEENVAQAIEDLGTPQEAADQLIRDVAIENMQNDEVKTNVKKGFSAVWVAILAVFASPIALPLLFALVLTVGAFIFTILVLLASIGITGITLLISAPIFIVASVMSLAQSFSLAVLCFGGALLCLGLGALLTYASYLLIRKFLYSIVQIFGKAFAKGGKKNEK